MVGDHMRIPTVVCFFFLHTKKDKQTSRIFLSGGFVCGYLSRHSAFESANCSSESDYGSVLINSVYQEPRQAHEVTPAGIERGTEGVGGPRVKKHKGTAWLCEQRDYKNFIASESCHKHQQPKLYVLSSLRSKTSAFWAARATGRPITQSHDSKKTSCPRCHSHYQGLNETESVLSKEKNGWDHLRSLLTSTKQGDTDRNIFNLLGASSAQKEDTWQWPVLI
ncbi:hypothetical protein BJX65DRAFT_36571 [Aspergillus insuetus]